MNRPYPTKWYRLDGTGVEGDQQADFRFHTGESLDFAYAQIGPEHDGLWSWTVLVTTNKSGNVEITGRTNEPSEHAAKAAAARFIRDEQAVIADAIRDCD